MNRFQNIAKLDKESHFFVQGTMTCQQKPCKSKFIAQLKKHVLFRSCPKEERNTRETSAVLGAQSKITKYFVNAIEKKNSYLGAEIGSKNKRELSCMKKAFAWQQIDLPADAKILKNTKMIC